MARVKRKIVTICGSMRYFPEMLVEAKRLTAEGWIVLMPFVLKPPSSTQAIELSDPLMGLHRDKIDMSDSILVVGEPGTSTLDEIAYAISTGKEVETA